MMWRMEYLNVNLLKSPRDVIAYIVLHELAHLKIEGHCRKFEFNLYKTSPCLKVTFSFICKAMRMQYQVPCSSDLASCENLLDVKPYLINKLKRDGIESVLDLWLYQFHTNLQKEEEK